MASGPHRNWPSFARFGTGVGDSAPAALPTASWTWLLVLAWTLVVVLSFGCSLYLSRESVMSLAHSQAVAVVERRIGLHDLLTEASLASGPSQRNSEPATELAVVRDDAAKLDRGQPRSPVVNEARLARLVSAIDAQMPGRGHTSTLDPLRVRDTPDDWERTALQAFRSGVSEVATVETVGGQAFYRLMRVRRATSRCVVCHYHRAHQPGDVLGGVSARVPLAPLRAVAWPRDLVLGTGHGVLWLLGIAGLAVGRRTAARREGDLRRSAYFDPVTGLPNRLLFMDRLERALISAQRHGYVGAVLFVDLDRFKNVNDSLGYAVGDELLRQVAQCQRALVRADDTVARLGGDEFVILLRELTDERAKAATEAQTVAEKTLAGLSRPFMVGDHELHTSPSIGIALFPMSSANADEILKQADAAMHRAKESGRNGFHFYLPSMQLAANQRLTLETDLRHALERGELALHFQPQVAVADNGIQGAEALLRWHHPRRGMVAPVEFIPVAEETGLILTLGRWVLESACRQIRQWCESTLFGGSWRLAVNVSPRQFRQRDFVEEVVRIVSQTGAEPTHLELELTEGMVVDDVKDAAFKMACLLELGIRFAIDDFGTGYSSLAYLKRLPLQVLKIDRSFVDGVIEDPNDAAIVETILAMAHRFGFHVVAEGVDSRAQLRFLADHGCQSYQGYLFSRALPAADLIRLVSGSENPKRADSHI